MRKSSDDFLMHVHGENKLFLFLLFRIRECCVLETKNKILKHLIQTLTLTHAKETRKIPVFGEEWILSSILFEGGWILKWQSEHIQTLLITFCQMFSYIFSLWELYPQPSASTSLPFKNTLVHNSMPLLLSIFSLIFILWSMCFIEIKHIYRKNACLKFTNV